MLNLITNYDQKEMNHLIKKLLNVTRTYSKHSHKKRKDSLECSLDRVLLAAELAFPKIPVPRLPQHTSDVNIKCAGKSEWSKQQCPLHVARFLEH